MQNAVLMANLKSGQQLKIRISANSINSDNKKIDWNYEMNQALW